MGCFKKRTPIANVSAGSHAQSAYLSHCRIRYIIAVQIGSRYNIIFFRPKHKLLEHGIRNTILKHNFSFGYFPSVLSIQIPLCYNFIGKLIPGHLITPITKSSFRIFHNIALMHQGNTLFAVCDSIFNGHGDQADGVIFTDRLDSDCTFHGNHLAGRSCKFAVNKSYDLSRCI